MTLPEHIIQPSPEECIPKLLTYLKLKYPTNPYKKMTIWRNCVTKELTLSFKKPPIGKREIIKIIKKQEYTIRFRLGIYNAPHKDIINARLYK